MNRNALLARALAFAVDWLAIAAWGGALFGLVLLVTSGEPSAPANPWLGQAIGFAAMTAPVCLYFAFSESSRWQASLGKRALGLSVSSESGARLGFRSALLRNAAKFAPWELGHAVAQQAAHSGEAGLAPWVWLLAGASFALPAWWMGAILASGRAPYDRWARARVERVRERDRGA